MDYNNPGRFSFGLSQGGAPNAFNNHNNGQQLSQNYPLSQSQESATPVPWWQQPRPSNPPARPPAAFGFGSQDTTNNAHATSYTYSQQQQQQQPVPQTPTRPSSLPIPLPTPAQFPAPPPLTQQSPFQMANPGPGFSQGSQGSQGGGGWMQHQSQHQGAGYAAPTVGVLEGDEDRHSQRGRSLSNSPAPSSLVASTNRGASPYHSVPLNDELVQSFGMVTATVESGLQNLLDVWKMRAPGVAEAIMPLLAEARHGLAALQRLVRATQSLDQTLRRAEQATSPLEAIRPFIEDAERLRTSIASLPPVATTATGQDRDALEKDLINKKAEVVRCLLRAGEAARVAYQGASLPPTELRGAGNRSNSRFIDTNLQELQLQVARFAHSSSNPSPLDAKIKLREVLDKLAGVYSVLESSCQQYVVMKQLALKFKLRDIEHAQERLTNRSTLDWEFDKPESDLPRFRQQAEAYESDIRKTEQMMMEINEQVQEYSRYVDEVDPIRRGSLPASAASAAAPEVASGGEQGEQEEGREDAPGAGAIGSYKRSRSEMQDSEDEREHEAIEPPKTRPCISPNEMDAAFEEIPGEEAQDDDPTTPGGSQAGTPKKTLLGWLFNRQ